MGAVPLSGSRDHDAADVRAVARRLVARLDELLPQLGATYRREIEGYARLTDRQLEAQVLATSRRLVEGYFGRIAAGRDPARVDLAAMELVGRRRLDMGVSLDDALHAFRLAARETWLALAEVVEPGEEAALVSLASGWIERLDQASSRVATGYLDASHERLRRLDARRADLVDALLGAADDGEVAAVGERFAVTVAPRYRPVVLTGSDVLVRTDAVLAAAPDALVRRRGDRLLVLLPAAGTPEDVAAPAHADLAVTGQPAPPGPELTDEVRRTELLVDVAERDGEVTGGQAADRRDRRTIAPDDLPLERLVVAAGTVADQLAARLLAPLTGRPELLATLRTYLDAGSIPDVAATLDVHPNTVAHRLRRTHDLTGLDPRVPREAALLVVALAARETGP